MLGVKISIINVNELYIDILYHIKIKQFMLGICAIYLRVTFITIIDFLYPIINRIDIKEFKLGICAIKIIYNYALYTGDLSFPLIWLCWVINYEHFSNSDYKIRTVY